MISRSLYQSKGFTFRGMLAALHLEGLTQRIRAAVPQEVQALFDVPPVASAWVPGWQSDAVNEAVFHAVGEAGLRRMSRAAIQKGAFIVIRPVVDSMVRVAGVSPDVLLSQLGRLAATTVKGLDHRYESTGPTKGVMHVTVAGHPPPAFFMAHAGSLEMVFDVCGLQGAFTGTVTTPRAADTVARHEVSWSARE